MYANINQKPLTKNDKILIVLGATHTAYLDVFIEHNPKFKLRNTLNYLDF